MKLAHQNRLTQIWHIPSAKLGQDLLEWTKDVCK